MALLSALTGNAYEIKEGEVYEKYNSFLIEGEKIQRAYKLVRDMIIFTEHRIIIIDLQGLSGKKKSFKTIFYSNIVNVECETAGMGLGGGSARG